VIGPAPQPAHSRRPGRASRVGAALLILLGALILADGLTTLVWQEPLSALYASLRQSSLNGELRRVEHAAPTPAATRQLASIPDERRRIAFLARQLEHHAGDGSPVGRILIPRIGASFVVVNGTSTEDLMSGPGILRQSRFPGISGTTAIAGHRTTYLAPFRHIDALSPGDQIILLMPYAHLDYTVVGQRVVAPTDVSAAVASVGYTRLVLSACTPVFTAEKRLLIYARLTRTVPVGAASRMPGGKLAAPIEAGASRAHTS
jgi:sortase A